MTSLADAEARLLGRLAARARAGQSSHVTHIDIVLCEDCESVMIYFDTIDEKDAVAACFDLDDMPFMPETIRAALNLRVN